MTEKDSYKDKPAAKAEIVNIAPELNACEREEAKRRIERGLYGIFAKYLPPRT